ncbi:MAG TPA: hypothetical protein VJ813_09485, partial [Vicinamibacterales bacterium]|nr:hypothetical protein [Vicinamibacterales bacterium]
MNRFRVGIAAAFLAALSISLPSAQTKAPPPAAKPAASVPARVEMTIDSIMRGPDLVGYPPSGLRWSGDSSKLYFQWRKPGEEEASTYVVDRSGGEPKKLSEAEAKNAPPANGRWDKARKRILFGDRGDVVIYELASGTRRQVTRTSGGEGNPRWARNDTHVTYVSGGNLFIVPVDGSGALVTQLTDVTQRRQEPRLTDSQKFIKEEEQKLIDAVRERAEQRKKREDEAKAERLPQFELASQQQSATDLMLSPDETHAFIVVNERPGGAKNTIVPSYVTESGYVEDIPARTNVGDTQDRRLLAILNLKTGKSVWADGSFAPPVSDEEKPKAAGATGPDGKPGRAAEREIRWSMPAVSDDGKFVVASARSADNKDRWFVTLDPVSGKTKVIDTLHDDAWIREIGFGGSSVDFLPDSNRVWFLSERDGWMHLYT